ncbi:MAG: NAD(P)/FAD-dependent oxidoreductase, partial [Clostridia bacterium]|nr:NAD(P)/FAD-dependent oxidoreductase [Clostridia bacterium]
MIRYQFSVPANNTNSVLECLHKKVKIIDISNFRIVKKSIDARDKKDVRIIYLVEFSSKNEEYLLKHGATTINQKLPQSIDEYLNGFKSKNTVDCVVVGSGPAGLFCALTLIKLGHRVIILERGKSVDERKTDIDLFNSSLQLDNESNVLFGEGGAGTFSDGKLNTNLHNEFIQVVLGEFYNYGANESILYDSKPHVGTDVLIKVLKNIRKDIEQLGGKYCFNTRLESVETTTDSLIKIKTNKGEIETKNLFLAIGHSARDTFEMLYDKGIKMESKIFSAGVRIEHLKQDIDFAQYGELLFKNDGISGIVSMQGS